MKVRSIADNTQRGRSRVSVDVPAWVDDAMKVFTEAARGEVEENRRLGLPSPGSRNGKIVMRKLRRRRTDGVKTD